jgi:hypothetical protein
MRIEVLKTWVVGRESVGNFYSFSLTLRFCNARSLYGDLEDSKFRLSHAQVAKGKR